MESKLLEQLRIKYPKLEYIYNYNLICGTMEIECNCKGVYLFGDFEIKIDLNYKLPRVYETSKKIKNDYPHYYKENGQLCLATDLEQEIYLINHNIIEWIDEYVYKYFITYLYYYKIGEYPFGEYLHGDEGIYQFLMKKFGVLNTKQAKRIFKYICTKKYKKVDYCPCGSNKNIEKCHGRLIKKLIDSDEINIYKVEYIKIESKNIK